jgi:hypothetical protein
MGRIDRETDAALAQLNSEVLSGIPGGEFAELIGDLLMLVGAGGPLALVGGVSNLALKVRKLAGASYASNLIYAITAVRNDLATLYDRHEELRERIESLQTDPKFVEAISALALRAMHTSVKNRLKRLARIVVNGVKEDDLEPESLDDMMRAAVELKDADIMLLGEIYEMLRPFMYTQNWIDKQVAQKWNELAGYWQRYWNENHERYMGLSGMLLMGSFARLESLGMIAPGPNRSSASSPVAQCYFLLPEGACFYERLQGLALQQ